MSNGAIKYHLSISRQAYSKGLKIRDKHRRRGSDNKFAASVEKYKQSKITLQVRWFVSEQSLKAPPEIKIEAEKA